ncbi:MAG: hypothetical protein ACLPOO_03470 [Terriglobales bacterium]
MARLTVVFVALALVALNGYSQTQEAKHAKSNQQPSPPIGGTPVEESNSGNLQSKPSQHIDADVRVIQTPKKDGYDLASFWVTLCLGIIGIVGVIVGICTFLTIRRQTLELSIQNRNMVAKERARLEITFPDESESMIARPDGPIYLGSFRLNLKNIGGTAAYNIVASYDAFGSESEIAPTSENLFYLVVPDFVEGNSFEPTETLTINRRFSEAVAPAIFYVYLRCLIQYNDIFKQERNTTKVLLRREFMRVPGGAKSNIFWEKVGNPSDNGST